MQTFGDLLSHFAQFEQEVREYNATPGALPNAGRAESRLENAPQYRAYDTALAVPTAPPTVDDLAAEMEQKWTDQLQVLLRGEQQINQYSEFVRRLMSNRDYIRILQMYDSLLQTVDMALRAVEQVRGSINRGEGVRNELHRLFLACLEVLRANNARAGVDDLDGMMAEIDAFVEQLPR